MSSSARRLRIGVVLPHEEIPLDAVALRDYAQGMEALQRPIPIWFGGGRVKASLRRIVRLADGWFPLIPARRGRDGAD